MQTINKIKKKKNNKKTNFVIQVSFLFDHLGYFLTILRLDQPVSRVC